MGSMNYELLQRFSNPNRQIAGLPDHQIIGSPDRWIATTMTPSIHK